MRIEDILDMPTVAKSINRPTHESVFRSYQILSYVIEMAERGDSAKSIFELATFLRNSPDKDYKNDTI